MKKIISSFVFILLSGCSQSDDYLSEANIEIKKNYPNIEIEKIRKVDDKFSVANYHSYNL